MDRGRIFERKLSIRRKGWRTCALVRWAIGLGVIGGGGLARTTGRSSWSIRGCQSCGVGGKGRWSGCIASILLGTGSWSWNIGLDVLSLEEGRQLFELLLGNNRVQPVEDTVESRRNLVLVGYLFRLRTMDGRDLLLHFGLVVRNRFLCLIHRGQLCRLFSYRGLE